MPFPFFAHQAAVVPLKLALPRRLSGTGLVLGSMAPDFGYFLLGNGTAPRLWHRPLGVLVLCLPVALALHWFVTRLIAEPTARHLPMAGGFRLRALGWLAAQPRDAAHWAIVGTSIVVGAGTHLAWDLFTHTGTWMGDYIPFLNRRLFSLPGYDVVGTNALWTVSTLLGGATTLAVLRHIGTHDLVRVWAEERAPGSTTGLAPLAPPAPRVFWSVVVAVFVLAAVAGYVLRPGDFHWYERATWVIVFLRASLAGFIALCLMSLRERRRFAILSPRS